MGGTYLVLHSIYAARNVSSEILMILRRSAQV